MSCHTPFRKDPPKLVDGRPEFGSLTMHLGRSRSRYSNGVALAILELDFQRTYMIVRMEDQNFTYKFTWNGLVCQLLRDMYTLAFAPRYLEGHAPQIESEEFEQFMSISCYLRMSETRLGGGWRPEFSARPSTKVVNDNQ